MERLLDRLPAWARHLIIIAGGAVAGVVLNAVVANHGVTDVDWGPVLRTSLNTAAAAAAAALAALWGLPITSQYGVGSASTTVPADPAGALGTEEENESQWAVGLDVSAAAAEPLPA